MTNYESTTTRLQHERFNACTLIEDLLPLYIEGEVSPATRDLLAEHLAQCDHCAGFLAGAQSTRMQLRNDAQSRARVLVQDRPAQQAVSNGRRFFRNLFELGIAGIVIVVSGAIWAALYPPLQALGTMLAMVCFCVLVVMVFRRGAPTIGHLLKLGAVCVAAGIGGVSLLQFGDEVAPFFGMLLMIGSIAGFRYLSGDRVGNPS